LQNSFAAPASRHGCLCLHHGGACAAWQTALWCLGVFRAVMLQVGGIAACRWTMAMQVWELPWRPTVLISGRSYYTVDLVSGLITQHKDVWDALDNNQFPSPEAIILLAQQVRQRGQQLMFGSVGLHASDCQHEQHWLGAKGSPLAESTSTYPKCAACAGCSPLLDWMWPILRAALLTVSNRRGLCRCTGAGLVPDA
jgi:hypothetical protein